MADCPHRWSNAFKQEGTLIIIDGGTLRCNLCGAEKPNEIQWYDASDPTKWEVGDVKVRKLNA